MFLKDSWETDTFVTNYLPLALFPILYVGAKLYFRTPMVKPEEMDFISGLKEIEAATYDEPPPRNWVERFWGWLVRSAFSSFLRLLLAIDDTDYRVPARRCKTTTSTETMLFASLLH